MDIDLIETSIKYHGKELYDILAKENDLAPAKDAVKYTDGNEGGQSSQERELAYQTESELGR